MNPEKSNSKSLKTFLTIAISLVFAGFFMWLALGDMDFSKIKESFVKANYFWILAATFFGVLAYWFRAVRWNLLLEPLGHKISNSNAMWTISFGYLMNLTIPRSGEVARATALYGVEKVPVDKSFGTIILERVVDLVCMMGFLALTLIFKNDAILKFYEYATEEKKSANTEPTSFEKWLMNIGVTNVETFYSVVKIGILSIFILVFLWLVFFKREKLISFIKGIFEGVLSIFKMKNPIKFILYSLAIWICYFFAAYLVCFALPETSDFTIADGFFIIVVGTLGMIVPASGGVGAFHFALKLGIGALFLAVGKSFEEGSEVGLSYAFLSHTMQLVIMVVMGLISIPMLAKSRNKLTEKEEFEGK